MRISCKLFILQTAQLCVCYISTENPMGSKKSSDIWLVHIADSWDFVVFIALADQRKLLRITCYEMGSRGCLREIFSGRTEWQKIELRRFSMRHYHKVEWFECDEEKPVGTESQIKEIFLFRWNWFRCCHISHKEQKMPTNSTGFFWRRNNHVIKNGSSVDIWIMEDYRDTNNHIGNV